MSTEQLLREKLRKIEALFAGAATAGERAAADAAAERIRERLKGFEAQEEAVEIKFSLHDPWSRRLFVALCRRYGLRPYKYPRMRRQSLIVMAPQSFLDQVLWPEFLQLDEALADYLAEVTDRVIREEVYGETGEADEVEAPPLVARAARP